MATRRKASSNEGAGKDTKRRRKVKGTPKSGNASFNDLNVDCLVVILSFLRANDMDSVAVMNRNSSEARNNESLDQTRTGTIVCSENSTIRSIYNALRKWEGVFSEKRNHLKFKDIDMVRNVFTLSGGESLSLPHVTSLDLSCSPKSNRKLYGNAILNTIMAFFPSLRELSLVDVKMENGATPEVLQLRGGIRNLTLVGTRSENCIRITARGLRHVKNLYLDESNLVEWGHEDMNLYESTQGTHRNCFMFSSAKDHLERLSIKGATFSQCFYYGKQRSRYYGTPKYQPISQGMLMKMVRRHRTLRWLKSDLSEENVAILKRERPEITFVS